jgi:hypothetical protein
MSTRVSSGLLHFFWAASLAVAAGAYARPVVIENISSFGTPDPAYTSFGGDVAIDGTFALVLATHDVENADNPSRPFQAQTAFMFQRSGTGWRLVRRLNEYVIHPDFQHPPGIAMRGGVAAAQIGPIDIWELATTGTGTRGWVRRASLPAIDNPGSSIAIDGTRVINGQGSCSWNGQVYEKNASGAWVVGPTIAGLTRADGCDDEFHGGEVAIGPRWALVQQPDAEDRAFPSTLILDDRWTPYSEARPEDDVTTFGPRIAVLGDDVLVGGSDVTGTLVYREEPFHGFHLMDRIQTLDSYMGAGRSLGFARDGDLLLQRSDSPDRGAGVVHVFKRRSDASYEHVATLVGRNGQSLTGAVAISGRRVLVSGAGGLVHYFELPATFSAPAPRQDTFATGNGTGWTTSAGSAFATTGAGASRVFRQSQTGVLARSVYSGADWTNQAIEADVRIRQFATSGSGVGLTTRYQGEATNYFEALLSNSGRVELRRRASGTLRTLASAAFRPALDRTYRLRLESIGTQHRVYVDGVLLLDVDAGGATHGRAALVTDRASADFDNVVLTPSPRTTMYATDFEDSAGPWKKTGYGFWNLWAGESQVWFQSSVAGDARATIGVPADDQVVHVRARLNTFAAPTGTQERWFGVMARHSDTRNYYYLSLRSSNTLSLRKLVDGVATPLATTTFTVEPATWYDRRLVAVGNLLRASVAGTRGLAASDSTHARGASGPVMYKTAADYDDFSVYQP